MSDSGWVFRSFRFEPKLYACFAKVAGAAGCKMTGAFERFMQGYVEADALVFAERGANFEVEARALMDWLGKEKRFYRAQGGVEVNVQGTLHTKT